MMQTDEIRSVVRLYEENRCLWDPKDDRFFDKRIREEIWQGISKEMNMSVKFLKDKMASLMGSYRREKSREKRSDTHYKSKWFAYDWFQFLTNRDNTRTADGSGTTEEQASTSSKRNIDADEYRKDETVPKRKYNKRAQKRRSNATTNLQEVQENLTSTLNIVNQIIKEQQKNNDVEEDEYDLYGRLLAKKLRQFSERESQEVMYEIDGLVLNRLHNQNDPMSIAGEPVSPSPHSPLTIVITKRSVSPDSPYTTPAASPSFS